MHKLSTIGVTRTHSTHLDRAHSVTMACPQVVKVHGAESEENLDHKSLTRVVISALVHDQRKVIDLQHQAEVNHGTQFASDHHSCFDQEKTASDGNIVPSFTEHELDIHSGHYHARSNAEVNHESNG